MGILNNKVAVITGGNSGIGLATAQLFAREGAQVVIFGRNQETLDGAVASLEGRGIGVQGDVSNLADLDRLYETVKEKYGRVDVLYVNAGIAQFAPLEQTNEAFFDNIFDVNVKGAYFTVQKSLGLLTDGASIVLTSSAVDRIGVPGASVYAATKAALRSLARTFSAELIGRGIRVNTISPGPIETPIFDRMGLPPEAAKGMVESFVQNIPAGRIGTPDDIAQAALFLASKNSTFLVGTDLTVDGGMTDLGGAAG